MNIMIRIVLLVCIICVSGAPLGAEKGGALLPKVVSVSQTVLQVPLNKGITAKEAADAMLNKALELNVKLVSHLKVSEELKGRGVDTRHLEILQLCTPEDAGKAIELNLVYAAYIPCRIALVEDRNGVVWAIMQNLDFQIDNKIMAPASIELAIRINQQMLIILTAGVTGEL